MGRCNKLSSVPSLPCHPNCYVYMASNSCIDNSLELTNGQWKVLGLNSKSRAIWYLYIRYLHIRGQKVTAYISNWVILVRSKRANIVLSMNIFLLMLETCLFLHKICILLCNIDMALNSKIRNWVMYSITTPEVICWVYWIYITKNKSLNVLWLFYYLNSLFLRSIFR